MFDFFVLKIFIISFFMLSLSHAFGSLHKDDSGLSESAFRNCPREVILAPLARLSDADLVNASRACKKFHGFCNVNFRERLKQNPSSSWITNVLANANWKMVYFEQRLFDAYLASQQQSGYVDNEQPHRLMIRFGVLKTIPYSPSHPFRPLLQEVLDFGRERTRLLIFDDVWQARMTDTNQAPLAHELRSYMFALDAVPTMLPTRHWVVAAFRDLFGLPIQGNPEEMFELARACGITAAYLGRPNALNFLVATQVDMNQFVECTDTLVKMELMQAAEFYYNQALMMKYLINTTNTFGKSRHYDRAMVLAKDLAQAGYPHFFQQLSLRYHLEAAIFLVGGEKYKFEGISACNTLANHVQSLHECAPRNIKKMLARMYNAYLQKYAGEVTTAHSLLNRK
jgi:hypothetical protein